MDDLEAFGPIAERTGFQLRRFEVESSSLLAEELAEIGLTPARATAIVFVGLHEGCDQMALGRVFGINRATTMKLVNNLVALGALERREANDRRRNALYLTSAGRALCSEVEVMTKRHDEKVFNHLSPAELDQFRALLGKLRSGLRAVPGQAAKTVRRFRSVK